MRRNRTVKHQKKFLYIFPWEYRRNGTGQETATAILTLIDSKTAIFHSPDTNQELTMVSRQTNSVLLLLPTEEVF
jgi:hypothetical protein